MEQLEQLLAERDVRGVIRYLLQFEKGKPPAIKLGFRRETELWDYKGGLPGLRAENDPAWADIAVDVAAFHNNKGGVIFFGIRDRDYTFIGTRDAIDNKKFNDKLRRYLGDKVWVEFSREFIQEDQRYLGVAVVPKRGMIPLRMRADAPPRLNGQRGFAAGDFCIRQGDSSRVLRGPEADRFLAAQRLSAPDARFVVNQPGFRILRPDYQEFFVREDACEPVERGLRDERTYVTALSGTGGVGKTSLACWAVLKAHEQRRFDYIISVSAKDRELTSRGIRPVAPSLSSFEDMLNLALDVVGMSDALSMPLDERESFVRSIISGSRTLFFIDNLETVEDRRIIHFLETLPLPVKAITTSRLTTVRTAAFPVAIGPMTDRDSVGFLAAYARRQSKHWMNATSPAERQRLVDACARIPLAIEWLVGQAEDISTAFNLATDLESSGRKNEELLEFCFRRIHSSLDHDAQDVLAALSLDDRPQTIEAVKIATDQSIDLVDEALSVLGNHSLIEQVWDGKLSDFTYKTPPLTRRFVYRELQHRNGVESRMRSRLSEWYEGRDIPDERQRAIHRQIRQGDRDPDAVLVDAALTLKREGKLDEAEKFLMRAIERNEASWRGHKELAELLRDQGRIGDALERYERAASSAPPRGRDRALVFREYGMALRKCGRPNAREQAIENFLIAFKETPNDPLLLHALADCYCKVGHWRKAQPILETLIESPDTATRSKTYDLLERCYKSTNETLLAAKLRDRRREDIAAANMDVAASRIKKSRHPPT